MRHIFCAVAAACFALLLTIPQTRADNPNDRWEYARAAVDAFAEISKATSAKSKVSASDIKGFDDFVAYMASNMEITQNAKRGFDRAKIILAKFDASTDTNIQQSNALLNATIGMMSIHYSQLTAVFEKQLNKTPADSMTSMGTFTKDIQNLSGSLDEGWKLYAQAGMAVQYALLDGKFDLEHLNASNSNEKLTTIAIAAWQRDDLKKHIIESFGQQFASKPKEAVNYVEIPPYMLMEFLNQKWITKG